MKKMFTLKGVDECGKSSKIKDFATWIITNYTHINHGIDLTKGDIFGVLEINKLKIGFVSAGDNLAEIIKNDTLLTKFPDVDILINTCRTKGKARRHLKNNYNSSTNWLVKYINVEKFNPSNSVLEHTRDIRILTELKTWITGLEKL